MMPAGVEMIVGLVHDPQCGPLLACGAGGTLVELLQDVAVRLTPLTADDARDMVRELKTFPLLQGFRGQPPADVAALEEALLRLSALAEDVPEIAELDCNPIVVLEHGAIVLDARIRLGPAAPPPPLGARLSAPEPSATAVALVVLHRACLPNRTGAATRHLHSATARATGTLDDCGEEQLSRPQ